MALTSMGVDTTPSQVATSALTGIPFSEIIGALIPALFIRTNKSIKFVPFESILYLKADGVIHLFSLKPEMKDSFRLIHWVVLKTK